MVHNLVAVGPIHAKQIPLVLCLHSIFTQKYKALPVEQPEYAQTVVILSPAKRLIYLECALNPP